MKEETLVSQSRFGRMIGQMLKEYRKAKKWSQERLAEELGYSQSAVSRMEQEGITDLNIIENIQNKLCLKLIHISYEKEGLNCAIEGMKNGIITYYKNPDLTKFLEESDLKELVYHSGYFELAFTSLMENQMIQSLERNHKTFYFPTSHFLLESGDRNFPAQYIYENQKDIAEEKPLKEEMEEERFADPIDFNQTKTKRVYLQNNNLDNYILEQSVSQLEGSMLVLDQEGKLLKNIGGNLKERGYEIRVLNLFNPENSDSYNLIANLQDPLDAILFVDDFYDLSGRKRNDGDEFFYHYEKLLFKACLLSIIENPDIPKEDKNLSHVAKLLQNMGSKEDGLAMKPSLDCRLKREEMRDPDPASVCMYQAFQDIPLKSRESIRISLQANLSLFQIPKYQTLTSGGDFDTIIHGQWDDDQKYAIFMIPGISDTIIEKFMVKELQKRHFFDIKNLIRNQCPDFLPNCESVFSLTHYFSLS